MRFILVPLFLLLFLPGFSQEEGEENELFKTGVRLGFSTTQIDGDNASGYNKVGFVGGLYTNLDLSPKVNLQFEMTFIQKGSNQKADSLGLNFYRIGLNYVELPLMFRVPHKRFLFEAGPSFAVLVNSTERDANGEVSQSLFNWRRTETALSLGIHFFVTERLYSNVRVSRSISPISHKVLLNPRFGLIGGAYHEVISFNIFYDLK